MHRNPADQTLEVCEAFAENDNALGSDFIFANILRPWRHPIDVWRSVFGAETDRLILDGTPGRRDCIVPCRPDPETGVGRDRSEYPKGI